MLYEVTLNDQMVGRFDASDESEALRLARVNYGADVKRQSVVAVSEDPSPVEAPVDAESVADGEQEPKAEAESGAATLPVSGPEGGANPPS